MQAETIIFFSLMEESHAPPIATKWADAANSNSVCAIKEKNNIKKNEKKNKIPRPKLILIELNLKWPHEQKTNCRQDF